MRVRMRMRVRVRVKARLRVRVRVRVRVRLRIRVRVIASTVRRMAGEAFFSLKTSAYMDRVRARTGARARAGVEF